MTVEDSPRTSLTARKIPKTERMPGVKVKQASPPAESEFSEWHRGQGEGAPFEMNSGGQPGADRLFPGAMGSLSAAAVSEVCPDDILSGTLNDLSRDATVPQFRSEQGDFAEWQRKKDEGAPFIEAVGQPRAQHLFLGTAGEHSAVVDIQLSGGQNFISFTEPARSGNGSAELGAIVKHGAGVKLESTRGDFAEWHQRKDGEPPFEEGEVVGFDHQGCIRYVAHRRFHVCRVSLC